MQRKEICFFRQLPSGLSAAMGAVFIAILALLLFAQQRLQSMYANLSLLSNAALYPFALAGILALMALRSREGESLQRSRRKWLWATRALFLAVLGVQFLVARCCWYKMGWDVATVYTTAEEMARGGAITDAAYFKAYPNNAPLTIVHMIPLWIAVRVGLAVPFVVLPYIDAILLNMAAYLCFRCVCLLSQSRTARGFALVVSIGWIALSPYILYPYTDTFSILFPVLGFYLWLKCSRPYLKWFLVSLVCFAGAAMKPTVLIVLIAMLLLGLCRLLAGGGLSSAAWKRLIAIAAAVILGMIPGQLFEKAAVTCLAGSANPQEEHGLGYWMMTGMNGETYGGHSDGDVAYANSFEDYDERQAATFGRAWERVSERSLLENIHFFAVKAYKAYADGSFASHSSFLELEIPKRTDALSVFLRSLYHKRGALMPYCQTLVQGLWLMVLTLCACAAIRMRRHPAVPLLSLTLMGLTAYLLLFEVWPRYLFLYAPFFVILAAMAFDKPLCCKR